MDLPTVPMKTIPIVMFSITSAINFVLTHIYTLPNCIKIGVKCSPVLCLMWFVLLHLSSDTTKSSSRKVFVGLLFSCIGDALLIYDGYFIHGMLAFSIAHLFYIFSLGFDDLKIHYGITVYTICGLVIPFVMPSDDVLLRCCIPFYGFLLSTMGWRSLAKVHHRGTTSWNRFLIGAGGILWMCSDAILAVNEFKYALPFGNDIVILTYYAGQLGIASSVMLEE